MPAKKFRFVSPGVQIKEIDKSQLPKLPLAIGPVVVGRTLRGPGMVPVTVSSYQEFVEKFGTPDRGAGTTDLWRNGNTTSPTYAAYAAEAWLRNSSPLTMVRLMGTQHPEAVAGGDGEAGWSTTNPAASSTTSSNGGAYGLFVVPSTSLATGATGSLAAVLYVDSGKVVLSGSLPGGAAATGSSALISSVGSNFEFKMILPDNETVQFNFSPSSSKYIRKVLNTNPTLTNSEITPEASLKSYWLGETFETFLSENVSDVGGNYYGLLAPLESGSATVVNLGDMKAVEAQPAKSGWVISQHLSALTASYEAEDMTKLFRFVASEGLGGDWEQTHVKVSILDIKYPRNEYEEYGSFTVAVRRLEDVDSNPQYLEVFTNCNLDPNSPNYVAAKIGDRHLVWDDAEKRHKEIGSFDNVSKYVRVEMNPVVEQGGLNKEFLPFGFFGPPKFADVVIDEATTGAVANRMLKVGNAIDPGAAAATITAGTLSSFEAKLLFPTLKMRVSASDAGTLEETQAFFGVVPNAGDNGSPLSKVNEDYKDLVRAKPAGLSWDANNSSTVPSFVFSLDDIVISGSDESGSFIAWEAGSRQLGKSYTSLTSGSVKDWLTGEVNLTKDYSFKDLLDGQVNRFTMPLFGGFDGLNIKEREPFRNSLMGTDKTAKTSYTLHSLYRAIDSVRDPEVLNMNLLVLPGITNRAVTKYAMDMCEARGDAMAIVDLEGGYEAASENSQAEKDRLGSVKETVRLLKQRNLNNSYACAYYPWVKAVDSESGAPVWLPPSIVALGTMASSQENSKIWFAPAGFNRGGLSLGSSGLTVVGVREKLTAKQRDSLYEVNINPIASFPSEGIVIFGQKTLQAIPSALDRINVRRLVLFLKKQISIVASSLLFEPNVQNTWDRFKKPVTSILETVKNGYGISDYKLVLDSTTTTAEEIDRNMMYAKLFIKPVYAIEFIGIDFVITNTGASFEDL